MNQKLYRMIVTDKAHHALRRTLDIDLAALYSAENLPYRERMTRRMEYLCAEEKPVILPEENIVFTRTVRNLPDVLTQDEWAHYEGHRHELGYMSNVCANYENVLQNGLEPLYAQADEYSRRAMDALLALVERYRLAALDAGRDDIAKTLAQVPRYGARTFREALQSFRIVHFGLWLEGNYHNTIGRFDQFAMPFLQRDLDAGVITREEAQELLDEFFLSFNRDSDLYVGVQQGDNGQSMMLGGRTAQGSGFNLLSEMCLASSRRLMLIDPKINVRVDSETPDRIFTLCSELTRAGLGFPQYSNDDVVIHGLEALGYAPEDAMNYTVAACWEFIIPGKGGDIANVAALSMPRVIDTCLHRDLDACRTADDFREAVRRQIETETAAIMDGVHDVRFLPSPLLEMIMDWPGGKPKYKNYGVHGVGLSTAADSLTAIVCHVYQGDLDRQRLIHAVDTDFADDPELLHLLRYETPKLGCNSDEADASLVFLMNAFSDALQGKPNDCGGVWRAGTGSAMFYLWSAAEIGASPDGRRNGEPFAANYSISLFAEPDGPFSIIRSMTKPDLRRTINGGPLTLEFHHAMFATDEAVAQVGRFVKQFIRMGGHQLQLNAVNAEKLHDAQAHPEKYPQLIVRIWGWSAYFVELDKAYQDHVILRQEYGL